MRTITLADGTVFEVTECGAYGGKLWITLAEAIDFLTGVTVFGDADKTITITHDFDGNDHVIFEGYTILKQASVLEGGFSVVLQKEDASDES